MKPSRLRSNVLALASSASSARFGVIFAAEDGPNANTLLYLGLPMALVPRIEQRDL
jgi:hypothetical protein